METEPQTTWTKDRITICLSISSLYFLTMGVLYLWAYWSPFHINILEYMGLGDVVKAVAIPVASAVVLNLVFAFAAELSPLRAVLPVGGGSHTPVGKKLTQWIRPIGFAYMVVMIVLVYRAQTRPQDWQLLPFLVAVPFAVMLDRSQPLARAVPNPAVRYPVALVVAILLPLAYGLGTTNAHHVASGRNFQYVVSTIDGIDISRDAPPAERVRFLGHAGDYLFFLEPISGSIAIERTDGKKPPLILRHFDIATAGAQVPFLRASSPDVARAPSTPASATALPELTLPPASPSASKTPIQGSAHQGRPPQP